ncbi:MAG: PD-(D/E)XK nuclease family protein [Gemmatimonadota bacterium]
MPASFPVPMVGNPKAGRVEGKAGPMVTRAFLGWEAPLLPKVAALHLDAAGPAPVVLPGGRSGRRFGELLLQEAAAREVSVDAPQILTLGGLADFLLEPRGRAIPAQPLLLRRVWAQALQGLPADLRVRLVPNPPSAEEPALWDRHARTFLALHLELAAHGLLFPAALASCRGDELLYDDGDRWEALVHLQDAALDLLQQLERVDPDLERMAALERGVGPGGLRKLERLWLVGVAELPRITRRLLEAVAASGCEITAFVQAPPEVESAFDPLGCVISPEWCNREVPLPSTVLRFRDRPVGQAQELVSFLGDLRDSVTPDEVTVGVADPNLVPYLEDRLSQAGVPTRYAAGTPLEDTPPFRLLQGLASLVGDSTFPALADLLRHPDVQGWLASEGVARKLPTPPEDGGWLFLADDYFPAHLPGRVDRPLPGRQADEGPVGREARVARKMEALRQMLMGPRLGKRLEGRRRLSQWMGAVMEILAEVYGRAPLSRGIPRERGLIEACQRLRDVAEEIHALPPALDPSCTGAAGLRFLLAAARSGAVPPEADHAAVELLGWLELPLDDAPVAAVLGVNEPFLPQSTTADPFLPGSLRTRLGLPDSHQRLARDLFHLTALLHSRREVLLVAGRRSADGDPLRPSRLLFATHGVEVARRVLDFVGAGEGESALPEQPRDPGGLAPGISEGHVALQESPAHEGWANFALPPVSELHLPTPPDLLRVTAFRSVLSDPYRFVLESIWGLETQADDVAEMDPMAFGTLAHEVLFRFGREEMERGEICLSAGDLKRDLGRILDAVAGERFGVHPLPVVRIQVEQLRHRLGVFAQEHASWRGEGWRVVAVEVAPAKPGAPFVVDGKPFHLRGRVDRVDRHRDGRWALLDYKTSDSGHGPEKQHRKGPQGAKEWVDLQLPLYRHLLPHLSVPGFQPGDAVRLGYVTLPSKEEGAGVTLAEWDEAELLEADEAARQVVRFLRTGVIRFQPDRVKARQGDLMGTLLGVGLLGAEQDDGGRPEGG